MTYPQILNKRIAELIGESYIEVPHERDWDATSTVFDKQKFAELIIKECISITHSMSSVSTETAMMIEDQLKESLLNE